MTEEKPTVVYDDHATWESLQDNRQLTPIYWHHRNGRKPSPGAVLAISAPIIKKEIPALLANLERWNSEEYKPIPEQYRDLVDLTIFLDTHIPESEAHKIEQKFRQILPPRFIPKVADAGLLPSESIYIRPGTTEAKASWLGDKTGPNLQFIRNFIYHRHYPLVLQYESDCFPCRENWLSTIIEAVQHSPSVVHGAPYTGPSPMHMYYSRHINGNAAYNTGHPFFPEYLYLVYTSIARCLDQYSESSVAFDVAVDLLSSKETEAKSDHENQILFRLRNLVPYIQNTPLILNISGDWEISGRVHIDYNTVLEKHPFACIIHSKRLVESYLAGSLRSQPCIPKRDSGINISQSQSLDKLEPSKNMNFYSRNHRMARTMRQRCDKVYSHTLIPSVKCLSAAHASEIIGAGILSTGYICGYRQILSKCKDFISESVSRSFNYLLQ